MLFKHVIWNAFGAVDAVSLVWHDTVRVKQKAYRHTQDSTFLVEPESLCRILAAQGTVELSHHRSWAHCYSCTAYTRSSTKLNRSSTHLRPLCTCHSVLQPVTVFTHTLSLSLQSLLENLATRDVGESVYLSPTLFQLNPTSLSLKSFNLT